MAPCFPNKLNIKSNRHDGKSSVLPGAAVLMLQTLGQPLLRENYPEEQSDHIPNVKKMNKIFTIKKQNPQMLWGLDVPTEIPAFT